MGVIGMLMRVFSYLFHLALALFMFAVSAVALISGNDTLRLAILPWSGRVLSYCLLAGALVGLAAVLMALKRILPSVFMVWTLVVLVMVLRGYLFSPYHFDYSISTPAYMILASALAAAGGWLHYRDSRRKTRSRAYQRSLAL